MLLLQRLICYFVGHTWEYYIYRMHQERECKYCGKNQHTPYKD